MRSCCFSLTFMADERKTRTGPPGREEASKEGRKEGNISEESILGDSSAGIATGDRHGGGGGGGGGSGEHEVSF
ncbi:hypothetical protein ZHAS_00010975 [Anopheles sinensis]|uniref:Uncharacterized protein n=1 Tax=Anopheles sinensis TaxID=74873 RepID=A0A084VZ04_ANOSI|nr:hypothetical protein ZHAS_00010975 [Anopheles sinensis]